MGYIDIKSRENIDAIISKTLAIHYKTNVVIENKYTEGAFIFNPRLNTAVTAKRSNEVKATVRKGHALRKNRVLYILMEMYIRFAFSKHGLFNCKYIKFDQLPENEDYLLIMPGNMKIKVFNFSSMKIDNILKEGFTDIPIRKERSARLNPDWDFVIPIQDIGFNTYQEQLILGCTIDRLEPNKKKDIEKTVKDIILEIQQKNRRNIDSFFYVESLLQKISDLTKRLKDKNQDIINIAKFSNLIANNVLENYIEVSFSHGDFQNGNIFITEKGNVYILDWETWEDRSLGYDLLIYFYKFRYRRNYFKRIDTFLNDPKWNEISTVFYSRRMNKKQVLAIYFLEDILWTLNEIMQTSEKRMSEAVLYYIDKKNQEKIIRRLQ